MTTLRVLIADDHSVVRLGIRHLLDGQPEIQVVGEAEDGFEAVDKAHAERPDVIIMDVSMPGKGGLEAARQILRSVPGIEIIILTMHASDDLLRQALDAGIRGYLLKGDPPKDVIEAIRTVVRHKNYFSPSVSNLLVNQIRGTKGSDATTLYETLTEREREVLKLVAEGMTSKEIATALHITVKTIESHRAKLFQKLHCDSIADLVKVAIRHGLTEV